MEQVPAAVVHFYRAIVMHGDTWRERLDATTNWAVVTTVGVISFSFSRPTSPHYVLLLLIFACSLFMIMESRRYQIYDLWRRRIRALNQYMVAPALSPSTAPPQDVLEAELSNLSLDLGRAVPHLRFIDAMGYRLRRNYGFIFIFIVSSWVLKAFLHPGDVESMQMFVDRVSMGAIDGTAVIGFVIAFVLLVIFLALRAPSEQMVSWRQLPSPLNRLASGSLFERPMTEEEEERIATGKSIYRERKTSAPEDSEAEVDKEVEQEVDKEVEEPEGDDPDKADDS